MKKRVLRIAGVVALVGAAWVLIQRRVENGPSTESRSQARTDRAQATRRRTAPPGPEGSTVTITLQRDGQLVEKQIRRRKIRS